MNEDNCTWGAVLTVAPDITDGQNLVSIANIKNLIGLEISTYQRTRGYTKDPDAHNGDLEDKVVRSWMDMALQNGCLQHLRIVRFAHQHRITPNILWMLEKLPALELIVIRDCPSILQESSESGSRASKHRREGRNSDGIRMHGWRGRCLEQVPVESCPESSLQPLGSLLEICRPSGVGEGADVPPRSTCLRPLQDSVIRNAKLPFLSFELRDNESHSASFVVGMDRRSTFVFHRDSQPVPKRVSDGGNVPRHRQKRKKGNGRDLSDLLGEFLG